MKKIKQLWNWIDRNPLKVNLVTAMAVILGIVFGENYLVFKCVVLFLVVGAITITLFSRFSESKRIWRCAPVITHPCVSVVSPDNRAYALAG